MIRFILILGVVLFLVEPSFGMNQTQILFEKAMKELNNSGQQGDTSRPKRLLQAILEQDSTHLEAQWILTNLELSKLANRELTERSRGLLHAGPTIEEIINLAKKKGATAFAHYVTARYAMEYKAYSRALAEIGSALSIESTSTRFLATKGKILVGKGRWEKNDQEIVLGIRLLKKAHQQSKDYPTIFYDESDFYFSQAWGTAQLSEPPWKKVVELYTAAIKHGEKKTIPRAFAWNNASIAYRKLGKCQKAKEAAEHALEISDFGAAESNKQYAEFCLEMQQLGILSLPQ